MGDQGIRYETALIVENKMRIFKMSSCVMILL